MGIYSIRAVASLWTRNGGALSARVNAVAVCMAESGGNSDAVSPADDHGLWQINRVNFDHFGVDDQSVLDPDRNAKIAIAMSSNGFNWAPWCTCWINPGPNCGHGLLRSPQTGSPAAGQLARVAANLGAGPVSADAPAPTGPLDDVHNMWGQFQRFVGPLGKDRWNSYQHNAALWKGIIR